MLTIMNVVNTREQQTQRCLPIGCMNGNTIGDLSGDSVGEDTECRAAMYKAEGKLSLGTLGMERA